MSKGKIIFVAVILFYTANPRSLYAGAEKSAFNDIFLFIWKSNQTSTGAGHTSIAIGSCTDSLYYFSHFRKKDGGGHYTVGNYNYIRNFDRKVIKTEHQNAALVIRIKTTPETDRKLIKIAARQIKKEWKVFSGNCVDGCIRILRNARVRTGKSALINTPNSLVKSLRNMNRKRFRDGSIAVVEGDIEEFIRKDKNNVTEVIRKKLITLFGLIKTDDNSLSVIIDTIDHFNDSLKFRNNPTH